MPYLDLGHERIYYALHRNDPAGTPVILIHGAGENHLIWPIGLRRLPGTIVYAIDLPGHGKSTGAGRDSIAAYADWVAAFGAALGLKRAVLAGHSMGGGIVQLFALNHPEQSAGLILIGTSAKLRVAPQLLDLVRSNFEAGVDLVVQWAWGPLVTAEMKDLGRQELLAANPAVMLNDYRACDAFDVRERLGEIQTPVLILSGEADRLTPLKHAQFMAERLPHARLVSLPQTGHMAMLEAEEAVTSTMAEFVSEIMTDD